jgi:hypothetical protein
MLRRDGYIGALTFQFTHPLVDCPRSCIHQVTAVIVGKLVGLIEEEVLVSPFELKDVISVFS